jgi:RNA polymerase sigma-70 factor (ECF subfamily)
MARVPASLAPRWAGLVRGVFLSREAGQGAASADERDVALSLGGDGDAYERIVRRHQDDVARMMWRFTRDRATLEELVHDTFVEAYLSLDRFRGDAPLGHWLARIATRTGYAYWKRRDREARRRPLELREWDAPDRKEPADKVDLAQLAHAMLARLRPRDRLVLTLLYLDGRSVAEAAELSGWSRSMVKVQAFRARKKFRALLEEEFGDAEDLSWMK